MLGARKLVAVRVSGAALARRLGELRDAGDAAFPIDPALPPAELRRVLEAVRPDTCVGPDGAAEEVPPDPPGVDDEVALVVATSGSTGEPKPVELAVGALEASARASLARLGAGGDDRWLCCVPLHSIAGLAVLERARASGAPAIVHERFDVHAVDAAREATMVSLVPTMLSRLIDAEVEVSRFRAILLGGAAASAALLRRARESGARVVVTYGMTETCGGCVYDGVPLQGAEFALDDDGAIRLRGPMLMRRYRLRPEATAEALEGGWFHTADAGATGADGRLHVLGRLDDMIVTGGRNVAPAEVADALADHPAVADVAVCGLPDVEWGERVVALVVPRDRAPTLDDVRRWVAERLAAYKAPRAIIAVDAIPRDARGKVLREELRRLATAAQPREP